jgi:hypothetical protein
LCDFLTPQTTKPANNRIEKMMIITFDFILLIFENKYIENKLIDKKTRKLHMFSMHSKINKLGKSANGRRSQSNGVRDKFGVK